MSIPGTGRAAALVWLGLTLVAGLAACTSGNGDGSSGGASGGRTVDIALTDNGCEPSKLELAAGPVTFKVTNKGTDRVTEFEVTDGTRILGEVENVTTGLERSFSLNLERGDYLLQCPGGSGAARGTLTVTSQAGAATTASKIAGEEQRYSRTGCHTAGVRLCHLQSVDRRRYPQTLPGDRRAGGTALQGQREAGGELEGGVANPRGAVRQ